VTCPHHQHAPAFPRLIVLLLLLLILGGGVETLQIVLSSFLYCASPESYYDGHSSKRTRSTSVVDNHGLVQAFEKSLPGPPKAHGPGGLRPNLVISTRESSVSARIAMLAITRVPSISGVTHGMRKGYTWNAQGMRMVSRKGCAWFHATHHSFHHLSQCLYRCIHSGRSVTLQNRIYSSADERCSPT